MKIVILDRDGVINEDSPDFIKSAAEWKPIPGSLEAIARLSQAGFRIFVLSNQSGIGRGLLGYDELFAIHDKMQRSVTALGGRIDGIEFAPDRPEAASDLRKPGAGMFRDLARRLQISLEGVPAIGDSFRDLQAAQAAGARPILVRSGNGRRTEKEHDLAGIPVFDDLAAVAGDLIG